MPNAPGGAMRDDLLICGLTALIVALPVLALHRAGERGQLVRGEALRLADRPAPARIIIIVPAPPAATALAPAPPGAGRHC
jgi:hypothetical protein